MGEKGIGREEFEKRHEISMKLMRIVWEEKNKVWIENFGGLLNFGGKLNFLKGV